MDLRAVRGRDQRAAVSAEIRRKRRSDLTSLLPRLPPLPGTKRPTASALLNPGVKQSRASKRSPILFCGSGILHLIAGHDKVTRQWTQG